MNIQELRDAGAVKRYHTVPTLRTQNIAEHSWNIACLVLEIDPEASAELLAAAMFHDVGELYTGDIPANFKWEYPLITKNLCEAEDMFRDKMAPAHALSGMERDILKFADTAECVLWCIEEAQMGNRTIKNVLERALAHLEKLPAPTIAADTLREHCIKRAAVL